jgi:solute carrier family 45, member 1/2/4
MTYCTPYLLKLGLTKSHVSLVWIAGPLSGLIVQPIVGIIADRSKSSYGRRRPFMLVGSTLACFSLLLLGWTSEIVSRFIPDRKSSEPWTLLLAVFSIYSIDFAINAVQASARSLIVDLLPSSKQQLGAAWASRMVAVGHLASYTAGAIDLTCIFGTSLGDTQFKQLIVISAAILAGTVWITCWAVEERVLVSTTDSVDHENLNIVAMVSSLVRTAGSLPPRVSTVCWIQFWSWIGWFPFLFYSTTWIGEVYMRFNASDEARDHPDSLAQIGRVGSTTLIVFSLVMLVASFVFPLVIQTPEDTNSEFTLRPPAAIANILLKVYNNKPNLLTAWTFSHIIFAGSMLCTPFVTSLHFATFLVAMCGMYV